VELQAPGAARRAIIATLTGGAASAALLTTTAAMARTTLPPGGAVAAVRVEELVALVVVALGLLAAVTLSIGCLLLALAALGPARWSSRLARAARALTPRVLHRAIGVGLGAGLGLLGPLGMAGATEIDLGWAVTTHDEDVDAQPASSQDGQPSAVEAPATAPAADPTPATPLLRAPTDDDPARQASASVLPTPASAPPPPVPPPPVPPPSVPVTVAPGDSLWSIAAAHLPADAAAAQIAATWQRWYAANAALIGPDPGLILPGQHLVPPTAEQETP